MEKERAEPDTPLERIRRKQGWTRGEVAQLCESVSIHDRIRYADVSSDTIRRIELRLTKPRLRTAATLSEVLECPIEILFPEGLDDEPRNPSGMTRIAPDRPKRAMARAISLPHKFLALLDFLELPDPPVLVESPSLNSTRIPDLHISFYGSLLAVVIENKPLKAQLNIDPLTKDGWTILKLNSAEVLEEPEACLIKVLVAVIRTLQR